MKASTKEYFKTQLEHDKLTWLNVLRVIVGLSFNIFMNWFYPMNVFVVFGVMLFSIHLFGLVNRWLGLFVLLNYFVGLFCI